VREAIKVAKGMGFVVAQMGAYNAHVARNNASNSLCVLGAMHVAFAPNETLGEYLAHRYDKSAIALVATEYGVPFKWVQSLEEGFEDWDFMGAGSEQERIFKLGAKIRKEEEECDCMDCAVADEPTH
jgi:hypothetical protein